MIRNTRRSSVLAWLPLVGAGLLGSAAWGADATNTPPRVAGFYGDIDSLAQALEPQVIAWRRDLNEHPELPNREVRTARVVADLLRKWKVDQIRTEVAHTGVVAVIKGARPGPVVALRADIDAVLDSDLPVPPPPGVKVIRNGNGPGVGHLLGHDMHTAILLGVAQVLTQMKDRLPGSVKLIFQPAEGSGLPPGEEGGSRLMIKEGALENPRPSAIFALHVGGRPSGTLSYSDSVAFASNNRLRIEIEAKPAPVMAPWFGQDPVPVMAQLILALQTIPSRQMDLTRPAGVITISKITAGESYKQLPAVLSMEGAVRLMDPGLQQQVPQLIERQATHIAQSAGMKAQVQLTELSPMSLNDPALAASALRAAYRPGAARALVQIPPSPGGENFAFFADEMPAFYFMLGVNKAPVMGAGEMDLLLPKEIDESAMTVGVKVIASMAVDYLLAHEQAQR